MTEESLFHAVLAKPASERAAFLEGACLGNPELLAAVQGLLAAHEASLNPLDQPLPVDATHQYTPNPAGQTQSYTSPDPTPGVVIGGRYTLEQKIGEGGMGEVWVAKQSEPVKRKVALKLIKAGMDSKSVVQRFEQERQALAMMDHPNIAKVLDGGITEHRQPFFVMELVNGLPLTKFCDEAKLSIKERLELFVPICQAVQHAHQKGIVHRDLKPGNILITMIDGKPVPKVIDFGVAKATGGKLTDESMSTQFGAVVGTLEYMSPEQAGFSNKDVDTRADIYSLGVILYELLSGLRPFDSKRLKQAALDEVIRIIREEEPSKPSTKLSTDESLPSLAAVRHIEPGKLTALLRGELDWVVMKCLEKQRERRYETANGLARDIQRYLTNETVEARPPSAHYRLRKFVQRNKGIVIAASLVAVALLAGVVGTSVGLYQANLARDAEARQREIAETNEREANEQRAKAEAEKKNAVEFRDKALDAMRATTGTDVEKLLGAKKELTANEKAYLEAIAKRWQTFARMEGTDEDSRAIASEGHLQVACLWQKLGRGEEARPEYERAVAIVEKLVTEFPAVPVYRRGLAICHNNLGLLLDGLGKRSEAGEQHRKALAIWQKLAAEFPAVPAYRSNLATSHNNLGTLLKDLGKRAEAEEQHRKALAIWQKLAAEFPAVPDYRSGLAASHGNIGNLLADLGQRAEAEEQYRKGLALQQKLAAEFPAVPEYQIDLGGSYCNFGILVRDGGKPADSLTWFDKAIKTLRPVHEAEPRDVTAKLFLRNSYKNRAAAYTQNGRHEQAVADRAKVFELSDDDDRAEALIHLGCALDRSGDSKAAAFALDRSYTFREAAAKAAGPDGKEPLWQLLLHLIDRGKHEAEMNRREEAIKWFTQAIDAGSKFVDKWPSADATNQLRWAYQHRADNLGLLGRQLDALRDWDRAIKLSPIQEKPLIRARRAQAQVYLGNVDEGIQEATELRSLANTNADIVYQVACIYSIASGKVAEKKQVYCDTAMELLQKAVKTGWTNATHIKQDSDLDPLRAREDFKKLVAELEKSKPPAIK